VRGKLLGFLIFLVVCLWRATLRIRVVGIENWDAIRNAGKPTIFASGTSGCCRDLLPGLERRRHDASRSRDGEVIAGFLFSGASRSRADRRPGGGAALSQMIAAVRNGAPAADLTTDGRGDRREVEARPRTPRGGARHAGDPGRRLGHAAEVREFVGPLHASDALLLCVVHPVRPSGASRERATRAISPASMPR